MLSLSSALVMHWLMPRYEKFHSAFPDVDLQFQLNPISVGGPMNNTDLGLRVVEGKDRDAVDGSFAPECRVPSSSPPIRREYPTTSAAKIAVSRRSIHTSTKRSLIRNTIKSKLDPVVRNSAVLTSKYAIFRRLVWAQCGPLQRGILSSLRHPESGRWCGADNALAAVG